MKARPGGNLSRLEGWRLPRWLSGCLILPLALLLCGCESIGYYTHLATGQFSLLTARQPVPKVLARLAEQAAGRGASDGASVDKAEALAARLKLSQALLVFGEQSLGLSAGGRYRSYVALDREAVVWNLFAAPPLSLDAHNWCYPLVGCAPYRGYFDPDRLERKREQLTRQGMDTYVGRVSAYSTLGWFDDPLLSTFIDLPEAEFVELLIHELAHSRIWVKGDATFNESFASFVGQAGSRRWFEIQGRQPVHDAHLAGQATWRSAQKLLRRTHGLLGSLYTSSLDDRQKLAGKRTILESVSGCLNELADTTGSAGYRRLGRGLNNAYLASMATYSDEVPAFAALFKEAAGDWEGFYRKAQALGELEPAVRNERLARLAEQYVAAEGDDQSADEIECKTLTRHGLNGESAGAEDDHVRRSRDG